MNKITPYLIDFNLKRIFHIFTCLFFYFCIISYPTVLNKTTRNKKNGKTIPCGYNGKYGIARNINKIDLNLKSIYSRPTLIKNPYIYGSWCFTCRPKFSWTENIIHEIKCWMGVGERKLKYTTGWENFLGLFILNIYFVFFTMSNGTKILYSFFYIYIYDGVYLWTHWFLWYVRSDLFKTKRKYYLYRGLMAYI